MSHTKNIRYKVVRRINRQDRPHYYSCIVKSRQGGLEYSPDFWTEAPTGTGCFVFTYRFDAERFCSIVRNEEVWSCEVEDQIAIPYKVLKVSRLGKKAIKDL